MATTSLDVVLERLGQNTKLTKEVKREVEEGFKALNGRVTLNTKRLDRLEWQRENDAQLLSDARNEAKRILDQAADKAADLLVDADEKPRIGTNGWLLGTLVTIILALIGALGAAR